MSTDRQYLLAWARSHCAAFKVIEPDFRAIGVHVGERLAAVVFFDGFRVGDCNVSVLIDDCRAVTRTELRRVFRYPFVEAGLRRLTARVSSFNRASQSLIERLGFVREGTRRAAYENGADEIIYGMLHEECRWLTLRERLEDPHTAGAF